MTIWLADRLRGTVVRVGCTAVLVCAMSCGARAAAQEPSGFVLQWHAAEGCPSGATAQRALEQILAERSVVADPTARVNVTITRVSGGDFRAQVSTQDPNGGGERHLEGKSCERVTEAVVLIVAMALETLGVTDRSRDDLEPVSSPRVAEGTKAPSEAGPRLSLGVRAAGDVGTLPKPSVGVGAVLGLHLARLHAELDLIAWLPRLAAYESEGGGAEIGLFGATLRGCYDLLRVAGEQLGLAPCLGAEAGLSMGWGDELERSQTAYGLWGAGLFGLSLRQLATSALSASATLEVGLPFYRPVYVFDDLGQHERVFRAFPVIGRVSVGIAWTNP